MGQVLHLNKPQLQSVATDIGTTTGQALSPAERRVLLKLLENLELPVETRSLMLLMETLKFKDPYTYYHSKRVAAYCAMTCWQLGIRGDEFTEIMLAGLAHDLGKIGTPDRVLKKPGRLTQDEFMLMKVHPHQSVELISKLTGMEKILPSVRSHHERIDGRGYPDALKGESIPLGGRIILVADTYDAMTSDRPYRRGCGQSVAFDELRQCAGTQFDTTVVEAFIQSFRALGADDIHRIEDMVDRLFLL